MTICIAAISELEKDPKLVFCADRLIGDDKKFQYESQAPKFSIIPRGNCIVLEAGFLSAADTIIKNANMTIQKISVRNNPQKTGFETIQSIIKQEYDKLESKKLLEKYSQRDLFISKAYHKDRSSDYAFVRMKNRLLEFDLGVDLLIAGFEQQFNGKYLPRISYLGGMGGEVNDHYRDSFGVVGSGYYLAVSELVKDGCNWNNSLAEVLFKVYCAKKTTEVKSDIGAREIDLGYLKMNGKKLQSFKVSQHSKEVLEKLYQERIKKLHKLNFDASQRLSKFLKLEDNF